MLRRHAACRQTVVVECVGKFGPGATPAIFSEVGRMARNILTTRTPIAPGRFLYSRFLRPAGLTQTHAANQLGQARRKLQQAA